MDGGEGLKMVGERWRSLAKEQRISAGILGVCGLIALVLSVQRIQAGILDPFTVSKSKFEEAQRTASGLDGKSLQEAEAKRRDTDGDGLSDYDEEKVLGTSPYLSDTDGDGELDHIELAQGQNPTCPKGQACAAAALDVSALASSTGFLSTDLLNTNAGDRFFAEFQRGVNNQQKKASADGSVNSELLEPQLVRDPVDIRRALLESGQIDAELLDQITDDQLLKLYDEAMVEAAEKKFGTSTSTTP